MMLTESGYPENQDNLLWQRELVAVEFVWRSFNSPTPKSPVVRKDLQAISYTSRVIADFVPNFVTMATGVGRGKFVWRRSIARPRKPPSRRKNLADICYTSRVIADFVPNFVAMATGVGRSRICLASFNSPTPKTPCYTQKSSGYLSYKPSYSRFCPKFRCHGNRGWSQ